MLELRYSRPAPSERLLLGERSLEKTIGSKLTPTFEIGAEGRDAGRVCDEKGTPARPAGSAVADAHVSSAVAMAVVGGA
jgi:hypothetical protein